MRWYFDLLFEIYIIYIHEPPRKKMYDVYKNINWMVAEIKLKIFLFSI